MKNDNSVSSGNRSRLSRHLSPLAVWALAFGCAVGWGAFAMPGNTFLPIAGPVGTAIGIGIGTVIMLIIGVNYHFLMNRYPDAGGTFSFTKHVFGYDHAFLSSWFMGLVYLAIIWANCTALPLIFRKLFGDVLQFGHLYTIGGKEGFEVYLGEVLLSLSALVIFGLVCLRGGKVTSGVQIVTALVLIVGVLVALAYIVIRPGETAPVEMSPSFSPKNSPIAGSLFIVFLAPWAFAGFESISQSTEEFRFPVKKSLRIMVVALVTAAAAYIILTFVAASAVPGEYGSWSDFYNGTASGADVRPYQTMPTITFNGIFAAAGVPGLVILGLAAAAGIITGLIGNTVAASRLICSMGRDDVIGARMGKLNKYGVPRNAVLFLILVSLPIPFLGRSATQWVIDINTIGVTIAYAYTSAAAFKVAVKEKRPLVRVTGFIGIATSIFFLIYFLIPNEWSKSSGARLGTESYLMLLAWILGGFIVFYFIFRRDKARRIGRSTIVWIVLMVLIFSTSVIWVRETTSADTAETVASFSEQLKDEQGVSLTEEELKASEAVIEEELDDVAEKIIRNTMILSAITIAAMLLVFSIYRRVQRSHQTAVEDKTIAEQSSHAKTTFLSNMSHDIRTPMNAIIGYVTLAKRENDVSPAVSGYLSKIEASSDHLLALINDVLEMSRIESGKMELAPRAVRPSPHNGGR